MTYSNMDNVPTQTAGTSELLASDWNTYVRDNFDAIKYGHVVCTSSTRPTGIGEGTMIYETDTNQTLVYTGSAWTAIADLDNFGTMPSADTADRLAQGHVVVADDTAKTALGNVAEGYMVYQSDNNKVYVNSNGTTANWVEISDLDSLGGVSSEVNTARFGSYVWNYWNPTNTTGTDTNASSTSPDVNTANSTYFTFSGSSGTLTVTLKKVGYYLVVCGLQLRAASAFTQYRASIDYGGTCTRLMEDTTGTRLSVSAETASDNDVDSSAQFIVQATAADQTVTLKPYVSVSSSAGTTFYKTGANMSIVWLGV